MPTPRYGSIVAAVARVGGLAGAGTAAAGNVVVGPGLVVVVVDATLDPTGTGATVTAGVVVVGSVGGRIGATEVAGLVVTTVVAEMVA